ncbi:MAG: hypothetical protein JNL83_06960 [Myxococcales bacterium]|nr:hypothetical protein [Myxococcales bacterium]
MVLSRLTPLACLVALAAARAPAHADKDIVVEIPGERSKENKLLLGSLAGGGLLIGLLGAYWHLDSRSASEDVSADSYTGHAWTTEDREAYDRAERSRGRAIIAYSAGGLLLIGAAVLYMVTEPESEHAVIRPHGRGSPTVTPTDGGALLGGTWSF